MFFFIRFRNQHNQLLHVISRVLKASIGVGGTGDSETGVKVAADQGAIHEVNAAYDGVKFVEPLDISKEGVEEWDLAMRR